MKQKHRKQEEEEEGKKKTLQLMRINLEKIYHIG